MAPPRKRARIPPLLFIRKENHLSLTNPRLSQSTSTANFHAGKVLDLLEGETSDDELFSTLGLNGTSRVSSMIATHSQRSQPSVLSSITKASAPRPKPQKQPCAFFSGMRRHEAKRISVGSIPVTAAKSHREDNHNIFSEDEDKSFSRKRNSRAAKNDNEKYQVENERPRERLSQRTTLIRSPGTRALASSPPRKSEPKIHLISDPIQVDLAPLQISIGRNVFHEAQLKLQVDPRHDDQCRLVLTYRSHETRRRSQRWNLRSSSKFSEKSEERSHVIALAADLREVKFYFHNQKGHENGGNERFKDSFLAMNVKSNPENGLDVYSKSYKPDSDDFMLRNIVVAVSSVADLDHILLALKRNPMLSFYATEASRIPTTDAPDYVRAMLETEAQGTVVERQDDVSHHRVSTKPKESTSTNNDDVAVPMQISIGPSSCLQNGQVQLQIRPVNANHCRLQLSYRNEVEHRSNQGSRVEQGSPHVISLGLNLLNGAFHVLHNDDDGEQR